MDRRLEKWLIEKPVFKSENREKNCIELVGQIERCSCDLGRKGEINIWSFLMFVSFG